MFFAVGARILSPAPTQSKKIGWIVDAGPDFPDSLRSTFNSWQTSLLLRSREDPTSHGLNSYSETGQRSFKFLSGKKHLTVEDLTVESGMLASETIHMICSASQCIEHSQSILSRRKGAFGADFPAPIFIWEPIPSQCIPSELPATLEAMQYVDIISPNHDELASLFSFTHPEVGIDRRAIESQVDKLLSHSIGITTQGAIVVRAGKEGCYVEVPASPSRNRPSQSCWLPAWHTSDAKVVDPTGGGNSFLGGLAAGLVRTDFDVVQSAIWGGVSASFCIEQVGVPALTFDEDGRERWNGEHPLQRLRDLMQRCIS